MGPTLMKDQTAVSLPMVARRKQLDQDSPKLVLVLLPLDEFWST